MYSELSDFFNKVKHLQQRLQVIDLPVLPDVWIFFNLKFFAHFFKPIPKPSPQLQAKYPPSMNPHFIPEQTSSPQSRDTLGVDIPANNNGQKQTPILQKPPSSPRAKDPR